MSEIHEISLRERIRLNLISAMEQANINQVQMAEKLGISKGTVNNWARGNNSPDVDMVPRICKVLGISILDLYSPTKFEPQEYESLKKQNAPLYSSEAEKLARDYDGLDHHGKRVVRLVADEEKARCTEQAQAEQQVGQDEPDNVVYIFPGYSVPMSAGTGQPAGDEYPETYRLIKEPPRRASFIAPVTGDSMEPTYHDGDKLFIRSCEEIEVGQIGVFLMDGQQWVKELGDGELISHNPEYGPIPMRDDIRCQGLVLGVCNESYFE